MVHLAADAEASPLRITVATNSDDDFVGFAIGFRPGDSTNASADYLLLDPPLPGGPN